MKVHYELKNFKANKPVVTIGTFDGVHMGHRKVLDRLKQIAKSEGGESVLFTFYPHPRLVLNPDEKNLRLLTTLKEKISLLEFIGIDHLVVFPFTKDFSELSYTDFVEKVLVDKIGTAHLVVGYDHKFGKNREGGYEFLKECASKFNFGISKLEPLLVNNINVSSTKIRNAIEIGDFFNGNKYLGYEFTLHGTVVEGRKLGREIGFPTANIEASDVHKIIPGYGVYAVRLAVGNKIYGGMLNIGTRPTFNKNADQRSIEVHIFDFNEDIYQEEVTLFFIDKIRDERKFDGTNALVEQLLKDKEKARHILK